LLGILHDEVGRRMKAVKGSGGTKGPRYYQSEASGWARSHGVKKVQVNADHIEELAVTTIATFLTDRVKLKEAVLSLGHYSTETDRLIQNGRLAARRLTMMEGPQLRELLTALIARAEVNRDHLRLLICCYELCRYLAWDGQGLFRRATVRPRGSDRFRMLYAPANLICTRAEFTVPVRAATGPKLQPDDGLINMLKQAAALNQFMLANRDHSLSELARENKMGARHFARLIRLNYLAPDIQAAIVDGTHPSGLTRNRILFGPQPLDWEQQRRLYGFPSQTP